MLKLFLSIIWVFLSLSPNSGDSILEEVKMVAVGDIMTDRGVEYMVDRHGKGDFKFPFLYVKDYFDKFDIVFGNLEGPISDRGTKVGSIYSFRSNPKVMEGLVYSGFNVLSLANNHALDYGRPALEDTLRLLKENNILPIGGGENRKEAYSLKVKRVGGHKIGFLAYTNFGSESYGATSNYPGIAWVDNERIENIGGYIEEIREDVDILIISFHTGVEYIDKPNSFQRNTYKYLIDKGADLIIGHHPHVIQPLEKHNDGWIAYSLGNFLFDQAFSYDTMELGFLEILIKDREIEHVNLNRGILNGFYQVISP